MTNRLSQSGIFQAVEAAEARQDRRHEQGPEEAIGSWLDMSIGLCKLPASESESLREELGGHLTERARDLMVTGLNEEQSVRKAIEELGDAALFAQRYRTARNEPRRRHIMNGILLTGIGASLAISITALTGGSSLQQGTYIPGNSTMLATQDLPEVRMNLHFESAPLPDVIEYIAATLKLPHHIHWEDLATDEELTLAVGDVSLVTALRLINDELELSSGDNLDVRLNDGLLEFADQDYFDQREQIITTYNVDEFLRADVMPEEAIDLIMEFVEPDSWIDNGGVVAHIKLGGPILFVEAPPRIQEGVQWILSELSMPGLEEQGEAGAHVVQPGETLDSIAKTRLGDGAQAQELAKANPSVDWDQLAPGQIIRLP